MESSWDFFSPSKHWEVITWLICHSLMAPSQSSSDPLVSFVSYTNAWMIWRETALCWVIPRNKWLLLYLIAWFWIVIVICCWSGDSLLCATCYCIRSQNKKNIGSRWKQYEYNWLWNARSSWVQGIHESLYQ